MACRESVGKWYGGAAEAGAGIVADSEAAAEWRETEAKARVPGVVPTQIIEVDCTPARPLFCYQR